MDPNATYNHLYAHRLDTFKAHLCIRKMLNKKLCYKKLWILKAFSKSERLFISFILD